MNDEPTPEQLAEWEEWCAERPPKVGEVARRIVPWKLYRLKSTDQIVRLVSYGEHDDGSVSLTVSVDADLNLVTFEREVFGVDPDSLEECDPPGPDEPVGALFEGEAVDAFVDGILRPAVLGPEEAERVRLEIERERK